MSVSLNQSKHTQPKIAGWESFSKCKQKSLGLWSRLANLAGTFVSLSFLYKDSGRYRNRKQKECFLVISNPFFLFYTGTNSATGVGLNANHDCVVTVIREAFLNFKIDLKHRKGLWHNEICYEFKIVLQN